MIQISDNNVKYDVIGIEWMQLVINTTTYPNGKAGDVPFFKHPE